jgi:hypothetical protein
MFEFFRSAVQIVAPIFVISTMLNVGLTAEVVRHHRAFEELSFRSEDAARQLRFGASLDDCRVVSHAV